jgi:FkbM family methyltransferase
MQSLLRAVSVGPSFRGRTRVLRALHRISGRGVVRSKYGPLFYNRPQDATNFYSVTGADEANYGDVYGEVSRLRPGSCFLDIGANAGIFSLVASRVVGADGRVIAFEPSVPVFSDLVQNMRLNKTQNVMPINAAIGACTGPASFSTGADDHSGKGHLNAAGNAQVWQIGFSDLLPLLDPLIGDRETVIKIDVEGAEGIVVESMRGFIARPQVRKIIVEIDEPYLKRFDVSPDGLYLMLNRAGFRPQRGMSAFIHYNEIFERDE